MLTKKQHTKSNRLRPKPSMKNKPKITDEDKEYLEWLKQQDLSCFSCGRSGNTELHHVKEYSNDKKNHKLVLPLCGDTCHRLGDLSPHGNPKRWRETFTMEEQINYANMLYGKYIKSML